VSHPATTAPEPGAVDLRRAPLAIVRAIDFRAEDRDLWADEAAIFDRFRVVTAGLDDAAWAEPGAAPSDAGGPDWSLAEHVAHVLDWQELALGYVPVALETGRWPADEEYDGGDFDRFNEGRRSRYAGLSPATIADRVDASHAELLASVRTLDPRVIRSDEVWGWVFQVLHGHQLDHLGVLEPWAEQLIRRQVDADPFGADPYVLAGKPGDTDAYFAADAAVFDAFRDTLDGLPVAAWSHELTPGWSVKDHAGHVAAWLEEGVDWLEEWRTTGHWRTYTESEADWNERAVERWRPSNVDEVRTRLERAHDAMVERSRQLPPDVLWSTDGIGWTYEVLHGHIRRHLAQLGPWAARLGWPSPR